MIWGGLQYKIPLLKLAASLTATEEIGPITAADDRLHYSRLTSSVFNVFSQNAWNSNTSKRNLLKKIVSLLLIKDSPLLTLRFIRTIISKSINVYANSMPSTINLRTSHQTATQRTLKTIFFFPVLATATRRTMTAEHHSCRSLFFCCLLYLSSCL